MTTQERDKLISKINSELNISAEDKTRRIATVNQTYSNAQTQAAEAARQKQEQAGASLKSRLKNAYMQNAAATDEDFERDYPQLKSEYLRGEAMRNDAVARESQARAMRESF